MCSPETIAKIITKMRFLYPGSYNNDPKDDGLLLESFGEAFEPYSDDVINQAFKDAIAMGGHFAPSAGDIIGAIKRREELSRPSDIQLWGELETALKIAYNANEYVKRGQPGRQANINKAWEGLNPLLKAYCGSYNGFMRLTGLLVYEDYEKSLEIERSKFNKTLPTLQARAEISEDHLIGTGGNLQSLKQIIGAR